MAKKKLNKGVVVVAIIMICVIAAIVSLVMIGNSNNPPSLDDLTDEIVVNAGEDFKDRLETLCNEYDLDYEYIGTSETVEDCYVADGYCAIGSKINSNGFADLSAKKALDFMEAYNDMAETMIDDESGYTMFFTAEISSCIKDDYYTFKFEKDETDSERRLLLDDDTSVIVEKDGKITLNKFEKKKYLKKKEETRKDTSSSKSTDSNEQSNTDNKDKKYSTTDDGSYTYSRPLSYNEKVRILVYYLTLEKEQIESRSDYNSLSESHLEELTNKVYSQVESMYNVTEEDIMIMMLDNDREIYDEAYSMVNY